jgi:myo-inositol-1(or 4)-monophosphatase
LLSEERNTHYSPSDKYTWVIDPLDGTTNYARGLPLFGVSIALLVAGQPVLGVLDFPLLHESYHSLQTQGAYCNGERIHTDPLARPDDQHFFMQCTRTARRFTIKSPLKSRILGSAAYHVVCVANGSALAAIEATPKVWDLAAAYLILVEAGGTARALATEAPLFPLPITACDYRGVAMPMLAAANASSFAAVRSGIELR